MAKINNKSKYKITPVTAEDLLLGTQLATGKTSNFQVEDLVGIVQERIDEDSIQNIEFRGEDLPIIDGTVVLPSKLSQFENDIDPSGEGGKIDNVSFKGEDLPIVDKRVELPSDLSQFSDNSKIIPNTSTFVDEAQVQDKIEDWSIKNIETIAKLKQEVGKEGQKVRLLGYYSAGDKPELLYEWKTGLGEDDGGSVINSTGGRWEALFNQEIDIRHFGAKGDYSSLTQPYTDNIESFNRAIKYMKSISTLPYSILSKQKLVVPSTKSIGFASSKSVDFKGGYSIEMFSPLIYTGEEDFSFFIRVGEKSETERISIRNQEYKLMARNSRLTKFWNEDELQNVGIEVVNLARCKVDIDLCYGFNTGVNFTGYNAGFSYNNININEVLNNRIGILLSSWSPVGNSSSGYNTSCTYFLNRIGLDANTPKIEGMQVKGIMVKSYNGAYITESITFINGMVEGLNYSTEDNIPIHLIECNNSYFLNFRHEYNNNIFMVCESGASNNLSTLTMAYNGEQYEQSKIPRYTNFMFLEDKSVSQSNQVDVRNYEYQYKFSTVFESGNLASKASFFDDTSIMIEGMGSVSSNHLTRIDVRKNSISDPQIYSPKKGIELPSGSGIYVDIDVSNIHRLLVKINDDDNNRVKCHYCAFDENDNPIVDGIAGVLTNNNMFGNGYKMDYYSGYDRTVQRIISIVKQNVKYIRIVLSTDRLNNNNKSVAIVKSFKILADNASSGSNVSKYNNTKKQAVKRPTKFFYKKGEEVINYDVNSYVKSWVAKTEGEANEIEWEEVLRNYKTKQYPVNFGSNYSQNTAFGEASILKKGDEVAIKAFANKTTPVEVGDTVLTLQPELRPKTPELIVGYGGNGTTVVWLMADSATGEVKVQGLPIGVDVQEINAITISESFFIKE